MDDGRERGVSACGLLEMRRCVGRWLRCGWVSRSVDDEVTGGELCVGGKRVWRLGCEELVVLGVVGDVMERGARGRVQVLTV